MISVELIDAVLSPAQNQSAFVPSFVQTIAEDSANASALIREGKRVGYMVWKKSGTEFVLALVFSERGDEPRDLIAEFYGAIKAKARALGCAKIVCTTERPGMVRRLVKRHGWRVQAVVLETSTE